MNLMLIILLVKNIESSLTLNLSNLLSEEKLVVPFIMKPKPAADLKVTNFCT
jgi:hypothetical protein